MTIFDTPIRVDGRAGGQTETLADHRARYPFPTVDDLLERVNAAGMRGYGGASFPVVRKWTTALEAGGSGIVVANGAESEPASSKDAALLQLRPHLVIDGLNAAVRATAGTAGVIWLHAGASESRAAVDQALLERRAAGLGDVPIHVAVGPARYLSGESSSVVRALSGGPALPRTRSAPAAVSGVGGRPTVVNNVETLARVAMLASGIDDDGRQLITISTPSGQTVIEAAPHDRLAALIASTGASDVGTSAVLLGGYGGTWHRWNDVASVPFMGLKSIVNAGIVMTLPHTMCGLATTARIFRYMASSSARQCGPCVFGLGELADVMDRVAAGKARRSDLTRLEQLTETVRGRGACHHPDGAVGMLTSAISVFGREFGAHRRSQRCARSHDLVVPGLRAA